jgi:hypothetical protein
MRSGSDCCSFIFAIYKLLICSRFIKEYQLIALLFIDLMYSVVPKLLASLCSMMLKLERSIKIDPF